MTREQIEALKALAEAARIRHYTQATEGGHPQITLVFPDQDIDLKKLIELARVANVLKFIAAYEAIEAENKALRGLVNVLLENDPDDPISDGGHTVLELWRHDARKALGAE